MYGGVRYRAISKFALVVLRERNPSRQVSIPQASRKHSKGLWCSGTARCGCCAATRFWFHQPVRAAAACRAAGGSRGPRARPPPSAVFHPSAVTAARPAACSPATGGRRLRCTARSWTCCAPASRATSASWRRAGRARPGSRPRRLRGRLAGWGRASSGAPWRSASQHVCTSHVFLGRASVLTVSGQGDILLLRSACLSIACLPAFAWLQLPLLVRSFNRFLVRFP